MRIDAHQHLWRYSPDAYGWISERMNVLRRDYLPRDLAQVLGANDFEGSIAVQARQTIDETQWLLDLAAENPFILGVVGWAPMSSPDFGRVLQRLLEHPRLVGLRHVIQDEPDDQFILREDFNRGVERLAGTRLVYDILIYARHLPQTIEFVRRHPRQVLVLDHVGKPDILARQLEPWAVGFRELARDENVYCKLSGMVTEAEWNAWSPESLRPYFDVALESFGPRRMMIGSDWPVCLLASSYSRWIKTVERWIAELSSDEQARIMGETAREVYKLTNATAR